MRASDVATLVSVAATAVNAVYAWPQVTKALRTVTGVSWARCRSATCPGSPGLATP
jgi:hypothetical protein